MITFINRHKILYLLFAAAGFFSICTILLLFAPNKTFAQHVPVKDQDLIDLFQTYTTFAGMGNTATGSMSGSEYLISDIATANCEPYLEPSWSNKKSFFNYDLDGDSIVDANEIGVYKEGWENKGTVAAPNWQEVPFRQYGDVWYRKNNPERTGPENPGTMEIKDPVTKKITTPGYFSSSTNPYFFLPNHDELADAKINQSNSLRCLLQELVEWEKLQLNMQMHDMVKGYFTDAQTYMLSQQLLSTMAAATIQWSTTGLEQTVWVDGATTTTTGAIYSSDVNRDAKNAGSGHLYGLDAEIRGGISSTTDLGISTTSQDYIAKTVIANSKPQVESGHESLAQNVKYVAPPAGNNPMEKSLNLMQNSPLRLTGVLESAASGDIQQAGNNARAQFQARGGYSSYLDCGDDPFCRNPVIRTPGDMLSDNLSQATQVGNQALGTADASGESTGSNVQQLSYQLQQDSLRDYNVQDLLDNQQTLQELFNEFEFVLTDYYGIDEGTTNWSRNMLVNTWDDIMWGGGAATKAKDLQDQLKDIKKKVEDNMPPPAP